MFFDGLFLHSFLRDFLFLHGQVSLLQYGKGLNLAVLISGVLKVPDDTSPCVEVLETDLAYC